MIKHKKIILQLIVGLFIAYVTYKIAGENYDTTSWFGGSTCLACLFAIGEYFRYDK